MNKALEKLRCPRGVTILFALFALLVATVVSAVILAAAMATAGHIKTEQETEQNYLSAYSAEELIRNSLTVYDSNTETEKVDYVEYVEQSRTTTWDETGEIDPSRTGETKTWVYYDQKTGKSYTEEEELPDLLDRIVFQFVKRQKEDLHVKSETAELDFSVPGAVTEEQMQPVSAELKVCSETEETKYGNYDLVFSFFTEDGQEAENYQLQMVLTSKNHSDESNTDRSGPSPNGDGSSTETVTETWVYEWAAPVLEHVKG